MERSLILLRKPSLVELILGGASLRVLHQRFVVVKIPADEKVEVFIFLDGGRVHELLEHEFLVLVLDDHRQSHGEDEDSELVQVLFRFLGV